MPSTYVYIYLEEGPVPAGLLETIGEGREATAQFAYGRRYLQRKDRLALDPVQLSLHDADKEVEYRAPEGFVLFNGIRDAAPDGRGRHLMDRAAGAPADGVRLPDRHRRCPCRCAGFRPGSRRTETHRAVAGR